MGYAKQGYPLDYLEINNYMQSTQTKLTSWEVLTLKKLSEAYLMQYKDDGINTMPPYVKERKAVSMNRVKSVFGGISTVKS